MKPEVNARWRKTSIAQIGQPIGPQADAHAVVGAAEQIDLGDAGNAQELIAEVDAAVVGEKGSVVGAVRREQRDQHQDAGTHLLDGYTLRRDFPRQTRLGGGDAVLGEDVGHVLIDADGEVDVELHAAVAGVGRLHVDHALDAVDLLLDGRGHRLLDGDCRSAWVVRGHTNRRRCEKRILLDAEAAQGEQSEQDDEDRNDDRDDRTSDEELCHGGAALLAGRCAGRFGIDDDTIANLLQTFDNHALPGVEPCVDDPLIVDARAGADGAHRDTLLSAPTTAT